MSTEGEEDPKENGDSACQMTLVASARLISIYIQRELSCTEAASCIAASSLLLHLKGKLIQDWIFLFFA